MSINAKDPSKKIKTIAIEGSDGAGKETQTLMLADFFRRAGIRVGNVSFPRYKDTLAGKMLFEFMKSPRAAEYDWAHANPKLASRVYAQDRFESKYYLESLIANHDIVIFDRYVESNLLHQGGKMKTEEEIINFANWLYDLEYNHLGLPKPDVTIYLDLDPEVSRERALRRARGSGIGLDAVESDMEYVRNGAKTGRLYADFFGWAVIKCVVPNQDLALPPHELTPEEVHMKIREIVLK
ncbi:MAG: hypothetical protein WC791_02690 [Candidatus Paceibacterota bacterium]